VDIYRAANLVIRRNGADAVIEAARMVGRMLELGDLEDRDLWRRIRRAIEVLQAAAGLAQHMGWMICLLADDKVALGWISG
jgi:hypothetical protein